MIFQNYITLNVVSRDFSLEPSGRIRRTGYSAHRVINGCDTRENDRGELTHLFLGILPIIAFERIGFTATPAFHSLLMILAVVIFVGALVFYPAAAIIRRRHHLRLIPVIHIPPAARIILWITALLYLVFAVGFSLGLSDPMEFASGVPSGLNIMLIIPLIAIPFTLSSFIYTVVIWRNAQGSVWGRLVYNLTTLLFVTALWQLYYWNLLGFQN